MLYWSNGLTVLHGMHFISLSRRRKLIMKCRNNFLSSIYLHCEVFDICTLKIMNSNILSSPMQSRATMKASNFITSSYLHTASKIDADNYVNTLPVSTKEKRRHSFNLHITSQFGRFFLQCLFRNDLMIQPSPLPLWQLNGNSCTSLYSSLI